MNYRSIDDLNRYIVSRLNKVPLNTDLIVGVPRSGFLAANILALHLNLSCAEVNGFMKAEILFSGARLKKNIKPYRI